MAIHTCEGMHHRFVVGPGEPVVCPHCELATLRAENERLKEDAVYIYNSGYNAGHHDTVEGQYTQVLPVDMRTYQNDVVAEILLEVGYDAARQEEG